MAKKRLLSGIQPTGTPHIGNYFGAMKQFVNLQNDYESFIFIADYHALTTIHDKDTLRKNTLEVAIDYLAIGLDPEEVTLFKQSDVPEHTELTWVFNTLVTVPYLKRAHSYKDKTSKGIEPTMGLFDYPVLMAADILMYDSDIVPVGSDQKQHIEYARDIAEKFNKTFGKKIFKMPKGLIMRATESVPGTDGQKMSKSYGNTISLFATDSEIEEAVSKIPTDSKPVDAPKDPEKDIVYNLHTLFATSDELAHIEEGYRKGGLSYSESKKRLVEEMKRFIAPLREKREQIRKDEDAVRDILESGGKKAREMSKKKMSQVREIIGIK